MSRTEKTSPYIVRLWDGTLRRVAEHDHTIAAGQEGLRLETLNVERLVEDGEEGANFLTAAADAGGRQVGGAGSPPLDVLVQEAEKRFNIASPESLVSAPNDLEVLLFAHDSSPL